MVSQYEWYGVENGVWFTASSAQGPWVVATSIPAAIYSIPPSSPLYYVTYVKIYDATPQYVAVGYTPGYMGTVVTTDGVVVYGTGYNYVPYIGTTVWYPPPLTYGYAANPTWTPWTGWAFGLGFGWAMGAAWGSGCCWGYAAAPYWGAMPYGGLFGVRMEARQRGGSEVGRRPLATFIRTGERPRRLAAARQATTHGPAMPGRAEWERRTTP
jgi:hypothetical protein